MKKILPVFSYIFHPLFIPTIATFVYFLFAFSNFRIEEIIIVLTQVTTLTILIPIAFYFFLRSTGKINSIMIVNIDQRKIPLLVQCFIIILLVQKSITIERYAELHFFFLGALLSTIIALILLFCKIKASLHMLAISSLTVFVFGLNIHHQANAIYLVLFFVLSSGFVASSRLEMNAHTPKELLIGLLIGSLSQLSLLFLWL
ncbi:hypothetical protein [Flavobacterium aestivum]|uniref:hypothetical protein n=1 Tax=Flavobacterium aestivum TaxID=3003257 RepID=UPI002482FD4A|nr:hypothetical protein [Flavobacterium aestivum]